MDVENRKIELFSSGTSRYFRIVSAPVLSSMAKKTYRFSAKEFGWRIFGNVCAKIDRTESESFDDRLRGGGARSKLSPGHSAEMISILDLKTFDKCEIGEKKTCEIDFA